MDNEPKRTFYKRIIQAGRDYFEKVTGNVYTGGVHYHYGETPPDDSASLREAYLHHLLETCGQVFLGGIDRKAVRSQTTTCLKLSAIYTALLTFGFDRQRDMSEKDHITEMLAQLAERRDRAVSALSLVNTHARLVLLGDPGSGKSTFVNFVTILTTVIN